MENRTRHIAFNKKTNTEYRVLEPCKLEATHDELVQLASEGKLKRYVGNSFGMSNGIVRVLDPILDDDDNPTGRIEVTPWIAEEQRFSWATCDPLEGELEPISPEDIPHPERNNDDK